MLRDDSDDWTDRAEMQRMGEKQRHILETLYYRVLRSRKLCFSAQVVVLPILGVKHPFQLEFITTEKEDDDGGEKSVDPADQTTQTHSDSLEEPIIVLQIKEQNRVHLCMTPEERGNISTSVAGDGASNDPQLYEELSNLSSFAHDALRAGDRMLSGVENTGNYASGPAFAAFGGKQQDCGYDERAFGPNKLTHSPLRGHSLLSSCEIWHKWSLVGTQRSR